MGYTPENENIEPISKELITNFKTFRDIAENIIMKGTWSRCYKQEVKEFSDEMFDLQIRLKQLLDDQ